ncbi:DUF192 domain-containing protein [Silvibacterium dinghuense]|uniref:DUF192 domain-containing protein n=1 Tax=Silvibacterium dinghuense TaxID=1560006 RepID=A0A4Q1SAF7_9BACT|nr:DUF192 domain-containing protein [Silvibacterium dinghuense]
MSVRNESTGKNIGGQIEIANTSFTRMRGLLGRRQLAPEEGLWIKPSSGVHTIGMKFAIDVIGLDRKHRVVHLWNALVPNRITAVHWKISSVLEVPAGRIVESGTRIGHTLEMDTRN